MNEFQTLVKENGTQKYKVTFENGETKVMRLFYHNDSGSICYYPPHVRKYGYVLRCYKEIRVIEKPSDADEVKKARRFLKKLIALLTESGLWKNLLENAIAINKLSDEDLLRYLKNEWDVAKEMGLNRFGTDSLWATIHKGFKKINYLFENCNAQVQFTLAVKERIDYSDYWRKGYDNSVSCKLDKQDGIMRAWYCEEYKGYGNGHYYLAVNATHAIFCEDD